VLGDGDVEPRSKGVVHVAVAVNDHVNEPLRVPRSMAERTELLCPQCGAPLPEAAASASTTCPFCGMVSAPAPPKPAPPAVVYVPVPASSAEASAAAAAIGATSLTCPRCRAPLFETRAHDVTLRGCGACGGIWLDNEGSLRIVKKCDDQVLEMVDRASRHATSRPDVTTADLPCPVCAKAMRRVRAPRTSVDLDVCAEHGTWFDERELRIVMMAFAPRAAPAVTWDTSPPVDPAEVGVSTGLRTGVVVAEGILGVLGLLAAVTRD
jgi:Zn-finger nucleic acid-binding protein